MNEAFCLVIGSAAGGLARYYLGGFVQRHLGGPFPVGTLAVNLTGCLIVGLIAAIGAGRVPLNAAARMLLITGFCGAFTTFSAFIVESDFLLSGGHFTAAALNIILSVVLGLAVFHLGYSIGKLF